MIEHNEIEIPRVIPVMTLNETVLFPQAMMPLYIFEPRYRAMLQEVLSNERIFAVASVDMDQADAEILETPYTIAGVGVVRACRQNPDGTSNLILQGLARVKLEEITQEEPFRRACIRPISSEKDGSTATLNAIQPTLLALVQTQMRLGAPIPKEILQFLSSIREPESILDLAIYALCTSGKLKQELLETRGILARFENFERSLRAQIERLKLDKKLKGGLDDEGLGNN
jgi:ATP-dependent Lon protease